MVCITSQGKTPRVRSDAISQMGRSAQGVRILNIDKPDMLIGLDTVAQEDADPADTETGVTEIAQELDLDGSDEVPLND